MSSSGRRRIFERGGVRVADVRAPGIRPAAGGGASGGSGHTTSAGHGGVPSGALLALAQGSGPVQAVAAGGGPPRIAYAAAVLADVPLVYWKQDETAGGTMTDSSGNARDGTYLAGPTLNQAPLINAGRSVNYANALANGQGPAVASLNGTTRLTVDAWYKGTFGGSVMQICSGDDSIGGSRVWQFRLNGLGTLQLLMFTNAGASGFGQSAINIEDGLRHHCAGVWDGSNIQVYIDGQPSGSPGAWSTAAGTCPAIGVACRVAGGNATDILSGVLDEVAVYGTALSAARIAAHYAAGI